MICIDEHVREEKGERRRLLWPRCWSWRQRAIQPRASDRTTSVGYVSADRQQISRSPTKQIAQKGRGGQGN